MTYAAYAKMILWGLHGLHGRFVRGVWITEHLAYVLRKSSMWKVSNLAGRSCGKSESRISHRIYDIWYMIYDIWYMLYVIWYMIYHIIISYIIYHISYIIYHISYIIYRQRYEQVYNVTQLKRGRPPRPTRWLTAYLLSTYIGNGMSRCTMSRNSNAVDPQGRQDD